MPNYLVVASGILNGGFPWSIRSYMVSGSSEAVVETAWDTAFTAFWNNASIIAALPTTTILQQTYTSTMTSNFKQSTKTVTTHAIAGTSAGAPMPSQIALVATLRTNLASKAGHGRWYLPAPSASNLATAGGVWAATFMTAVGTALTALGTALGSTGTLQVFHRNGTKSGLPALSLTPVIVPCDASNKPAVQRRRGDKLVPTRTAWSS